ncbi:OLC1v1019300C1 [Oldenlandia corymbosa var. corymbosa]|uniref:OLC1v1019300C1 n=1 Tax=Oldenlandia corymbosa var. corymbosa TaxID=529605 RepID=A0AAV1EDK5_OLDCO|nr:OLC1v1019300C1 [Oldenlandia corymbosa var. corymbosa]
MPSSASRGIPEVKLEEVAGYDLPDHIILLILKQFLPKSLLRSRCVSKYWLSMIDDSCFIKIRRIQSYGRPGGVKLLVGPLRSIRDGIFTDFLLVDEEGNKGFAVHPAGKDDDDYMPTCFDYEEAVEVKCGTNYNGGEVHPGGKIVMQVISLGPNGTNKNSWRHISHHVPEEEKTKGMRVFLYPYYKLYVYLKKEIYILVNYAHYAPAIMVFSVGEEKFRFIHLPEELEDMKVEE